jgi:hypothetical protein
VGSNPTCPTKLITAKIRNGDMTIDKALISKENVRTEFKLIADLNETLKLLVAMCDGYEDATELPTGIVTSVSMVTSEIIRISKSVVKNDNIRS